VPDPEAILRAAEEVVAILKRHRVDAVPIRPPNVREFLKVLGADPYPSWTEADTDRAADGWSRYVNRKRAGTVPKRPVADLLIGGYACRFQGLVTRNPEHFQPFYPDLTIAEP